MKTNRHNNHNNEENKTKNTQLRRNTMNATKLTMIVFSAAAIIISGCSNDNRITGPGDVAIPEIDKDLFESVTPAETENNVARIAVRGDESQVDRFSIVAEVLRIEIEGGCWYLSAESGDSYTPITPKSLSLELGMKLKASGYIDKNIHFFCGNGPAFVIEQYEILNESKWPAEDRAPANESAGQLSNAATEDRAPQSAEKKYDKKKLIDSQVSQAASEDRAPNRNTAGLSNAATEDRAPQSVDKKYDKKKLFDSQVLQAASEDRAPNKNTAGLSNAPTEDRAPQSIEKKYDKKKLIDGQILQAATEDRASWAPSEDRAPNKNTSQISNAATEDRAPQSAEKKYDKKKLFDSQISQAATEDRASWIPSEDRAPQKYEAKKESHKPEALAGSPVPIISADMQFNPTTAANALEGYVKKTKEGCLLLETIQKEVVELQHDMDVILETGTHIRVTGYFSALLVISCSDAPVFYAERMEILSYPKEHEYPENDEYSATEEAFAQEVIEAEGTMHATEPEGACWYFETEEKVRYELIFSDQVDLRSGMRLKIRGVEADVSTFCASGKPLEVIGWETVSENKF